MKAGRNDACPCGSGKKYKKCCLAKGPAALAPQRVADSVLRSVIGPPQARSSIARSSKSGSSNVMAHLTTAAKPPSPPDPIAERGDRRFNEFESQSEDGRIAVFHKAMEDTEVMNDSMADEMLSVLRSDA